MVPVLTRMDPSSVAVRPDGPDQPVVRMSMSVQCSCVRMGLPVRTLWAALCVSVCWAGRDHSVIEVSGRNQI